MEGVALVFAAHPDDAEIGMGGTIAALCARKVRVVVVDLTDGEPTPFGSPEIRAEETRNASAALGLTERRLLGIKNREVFDSVDNRKIVAGVIRQVRPEVIFAPYWEDAHPDHVQACALVESARFYAKFVKSDLPHEPHYVRRVLHYFSTHLRPRFLPSVIVDISGYEAPKEAAIRAYKSQFQTHPGNAAKVDAMVRESRFWGDQIGRISGEPFVCRETLRVLDSSLLLSV
jgi:bacillithiol biosynthesis deacetylase BshB1